MATKRRRPLTHEERQRILSLPFPEIHRHHSYPWAGTSVVDHFGINMRELDALAAAEYYPHLRIAELVGEDDSIDVADFIDGVEEFVMDAKDYRGIGARSY